MATINLGRIKPVNKGTWSNSTAYAIDDFVQYTDNGVLSTYIAVATSTNQTPSTSGTVNSTYWKFMAKGVASEISGLGNNKIVVTNSSGNATGISIGTAGQSLKVNSGANGYEFGTIQSDYIRIASSKVTGSSTSAVVFDQAITSSYNLYRLTGVYKITGGSPMLRMQYRQGTSGSESDYSSSNYRYINNAYQDSGGSGRGNSSSGNSHYDLDNDSGDNIWNIIDITMAFANSGNAESYNSMSGHSFQYRDNNSVWFQNNIAGFLGASLNPTGFRIFTDSGVFSANTNFKLFGMRE